MLKLSALINQLKQERNRLASHLENLNNALAALSMNGAPQRGTMSAAGRARIAAAQRARWAKVKGPGRRTMSASARKQIALAQKARWAKWRKQRRAD